MKESPPFWAAGTGALDAMLLNDADDFLSLLPRVDAEPRKLSC